MPSLLCSWLVNLVLAIGHCTSRCTINCIVAVRLADLNLDQYHDFSLVGKALKTVLK